MNKETFILTALGKSCLGFTLFYLIHLLMINFISDFNITFYIPIIIGYITGMFTWDKLSEKLEQKGVVKND